MILALVFRMLLDKKTRNSKKVEFKKNLQRSNASCLLLAPLQLNLH